MKPLEELVPADFEAHLEGTFAIDSHPVTLKSVDIKPSGHKMFRDQMCLLFEAQGDVGVVSDIAKLSHPDLGRYDLMVSRIENPEDPDGPPLYEIVLG